MEYNKLNAVVIALNKRFSNNKTNPYEIITRLTEECGELAKEVNHFEGNGIKNKKHGKPDKMKMAKEVQDVMRCAIQIAKHYGIEKEVEKSIKKSYNELKAEGYIK